jgi:hypothetical protein
MYTVFGIPYLAQTSVRAKASRELQIAAYLHPKAQPRQGNLAALSTWSFSPEQS